MICLSLSTKDSKTIAQKSKMKYISILIFLCLLPASLGAQSVAEKMNSYLNNSAYKCGKASASTLEEADKAALEMLVSQISVSLGSVYEEELSQHDTSSGLDYQSKVNSQVRSFSFGTLPNVGQIIDESEPGVVTVLRYVKVTDLKNIFQEREKKISDFVASGMEGERQLQINVALRYYNWALMLLIAHPKTVYSDIDGKKTNLKLWLDTKINNIFNTLDAEVEECVETGNPIDKYEVKLRFSYLGEPVSDLEFYYNNGERYVGPCRVHDGVAIVNFDRLPDKELRIRYDYKFENQAKNFDAELRAVLELIKPQSFPNAAVALPVKNRRGVIVADNKKSTQQKLEEAVSVASASIAPPIVQNKVERLQLEPISDDVEYRAVMERVEAAVRAGDIAPVQDCFTPDGFNLFKQMLDLGKASIVGDPQYSFWKSGGPYVIGKSLPMKFKFRGRGNTFVEEIRFRFDRNKKIASVAFGLTQRAEDDIFKAAAKWSEASRYSIMSFLEDYQTAYALKRLDFIQSIFSSKAIIITGVVCQTIGKGTFLEGGLNLPEEQSIKTVRYNHYTKGEYIAKLKKSFASKEFVHLIFEDNIIKKINTNGIINGEAYGIQIKQSYFSDNYADSGYLLLHLDMRGEYPTIRVRAWIPEKNEDASLDRFLNRFRLGGI